MSEASIEKFKSRFAHNGGETVVCENDGAAAEYLAALAGRQKSGAENDGLRVELDTRRHVFLSRSIDGVLAFKLKASLEKVSDLVLMDKVSDSADICIASASALLVQDGALIIDSGRAAHEETLFGEISVLVADEKTVLYDNMSQFFADASAGKAFAGVDKAVIIAGPSKTADIEKQVVLGMHGPKRLVCVVIR